MERQKRKYNRKKPYVKRFKPVNPELDTKLKILLFEKQITQSELAKIINQQTGKKWDRNRICHYVNGTIQSMTSESARIIANALSVPVDDIIEDY
jgi:transcriptional regulator with XRE-family HTH domain